MSLKLTIVNEMAQVAGEHGRLLPPLEDHLMLVDTGLDSLALAVLIARLEERLKINPFMAKDRKLPLTVGDFVNAYEHEAN
jgi:acyl carrier protein